MLSLTYLSFWNRKPRVSLFSGLTLNPLSETGPWTLRTPQDYLSVMCPAIDGVCEICHIRIYYVFNITMFYTLYHALMSHIHVLLYVLQSFVAVNGFILERGQ